MSFFVGSICGVPPKVCCAMAVLYFVRDVIAYLDRPSLHVYQFFKVMSRCASFIEISACVAEVSSVFLIFTCCIEATKLREITFRFPL